MELKELKARHNALLLDRQAWDADAKSLAKHFMPRKSRFLEGDDQNSTHKYGALRKDVLDGAGIRARRTATAGMHGGMTSPARPWFRLTLQDEDLAHHRTVRPWMDEIQRRMRNLYSRSNFYQMIHRLYDELITFGTSFMFEHEDERTGVNFNTMTFGEYSIDTNEYGLVDTVFRTQEMTARNIVRQFGYEKCSNAVKQAFDKSDTKQNRFQVVHAVFPRSDRDTKRVDNKNMPFASYYYEKSSNNGLLRESGYSMFPGIGPRWDTTGQDVYGGCPAMDSLGDVRMLQSVWATYLKQEHKRADPPVITPSSMLTPNLLPGGVNPVSMQVGGANAVYPAYQVTPDAQGMLFIIQDVRTSIREGMYNDLFKMLALSNPSQMTAREVAERHEEKLLQLGPVLERLHSEGFIPLIDRTFHLMIEQDMIPPWPEELAGMPLKVEFMSLLAQAQKMVATSTVDQFMGFVGTYGQAFPELMDVPDADNVADHYADFLGLDIKMIRPKEDRDERRNQRAAQQQQIESAQMAAHQAQTVKTMAETPTEDGESTALDALTKGLS